MNGSGHGGLRPSRPPGLAEGTSPEPGRGRLGRPGARSSIHGGTMPPSCRRRKRVPRRRTRHSTRPMDQQSSPPPRSVDGRVSLHSAAQERAPSTPVRAASKAGRCRRNTCGRAWRRRRDAVLLPEHSGWLQQACRQRMVRRVRYCSGAAPEPCYCCSGNSPSRPRRGAQARWHCIAVLASTAAGLPSRVTGYAGDGLGSAEPSAGKRGQPLVKPRDE